MRKYMKKTKSNIDIDLYSKGHKGLPAERILKWLEEAHQFVRTFLSPEDIKKWREAKDKHSTVAR